MHHEFYLVQGYIPLANKILKCLDVAILSARKIAQKFKKNDNLYFDFRFAEPSDRDK